MKMTVICVGKTREQFIRDGLEKYIRYVKHYTELEIKEVKEEKIRDLREAPVVRKREAERILRAVPAGAYAISLDERGDEFSSHEFAVFLNKTIESGTRELVFVIGGALGLDEDVIGRSQKKLALSRWTLTHELARVVLLEQVYRAFTILTGKTYHY